jgi:hypothetical protein
MCALLLKEGESMNREQFYKSKQWESFRQVIIAERTDQDGYVHCAICGKPILKKYDLIIHHKKELSEDNVNDAMIALNPDNVECVHFKCHNKIHERFGFNKTSSYTGAVRKKVFIVYGSPCAGKTTWVHENATENDLIVDMDSIWEMISVNGRYEKPGSLKSVVFEMRDKLYDIIKYRSGKWHNAFVIVGGAMKGDRDRLKVRIAADEMIFIDTPIDECIKRVNLRGMSEEQTAEWILYINEWFERFQPEEISD